MDADGDTDIVVDGVTLAVPEIEKLSDVRSEPAGVALLTALALVELDGDAVADGDKANATVSEAAELAEAATEAEAVAEGLGGPDAVLGAVAVAEENEDAVGGGEALASAEAADPELQDRHGNPFRLSSLRGHKVVLVAWSTY